MTPALGLRVALAMLGLTATLDATAADEAVEIKVYATLHRSIDGVTTLHRPAYFSLSDHGSGFDQRVQTKERLDYLVDDLSIEFGRSLGPIKAAVNWTKVVREDAARPGYADLDYLQERCEQQRQEPSKRFARKMGANLDVAAHGSDGGYPEFMGTWTTPEASREKKHKKLLPGDPIAAAELAAAVFEHNYTDFDRPRYFEPINEPHWSFTTKPELSQWHLATHAAFKERVVDTLVGGPCSSVAYFYKRQFSAFGGLQGFIDNTRCELDFYSFHVYDYLNWNGEDLVGRITSGLPLEGVLDLVQAHTVNEYGKQVDIVVSEQGGYMTGSKGMSPEKLGDYLAEKHGWDEEGFDLEMRKRSINSHILVSSAIGNTLAFMDHPHVVKKAVPFILLDSMAWDPKYYSTLYTPHDFTDRKHWVETRNSDYYKFFRDLRGERVVVRGGDPDLQVRAFADGKHLRVVLNNLSDVEHTTRLRLPPASETIVRRYGRNADFTPSLEEEPIDSVEELVVVGREAVMVIATYDRPIPTRGVIEETPYYATTFAVAPKNGKPARYTVVTPDQEAVAYARLRIGVSRPGEADPNVVVRLNGKTLPVPLEDAAPRLTTTDEYASTKILTVDPKMLRARNRVEVSFADGGEGTVGSVVLRLGVKSPPERAALRPNAAGTPGA